MKQRILLLLCMNLYYPPNGNNGLAGNASCHNSRLRCGGVNDSAAAHVKGHMSVIADDIAGLSLCVGNFIGRHFSAQWTVWLLKFRSARTPDEQIRSSPFRWSDCFRPIHKGCLQTAGGVINDSLSGYRSGYRAVGRTAAVIRPVIRRGSILIASVILRRCIRRRLLLLLLSGLLSGGFLCGPPAVLPLLPRLPAVSLASSAAARCCSSTRFLDLCVVFFNQILIFCRFFVGYGDPPRHNWKK